MKKMKRERLGNLAKLTWAVSSKARIWTWQANVITLTTMQYCHSSSFKVRHVLDMETDSGDAGLAITTDKRAQELSASTSFISVPLLAAI